MGAVAWITNGVFRDFEDVGTLGYQVYAKGTTVSHGQGRFTSIGEPVEIEGLTVHNGDLIHADVDGVQTVPIEVVDEVLAAAEKDRQFRARGPRVHKFGRLHARRGPQAHGPLASARPSARTRLALT